NVAEHDWHMLNAAYKRGDIWLQQYLDSVDNLALRDIANPRVKELLHPYNALVWQNDRESLRRGRDSHFLTPNRKGNGESGKVLYYLEKVVEEPGTVDPAHYRNVIKMQLFIAADDVRNAAAIFDIDSSYYNTIPGMIASGTYKGDPQSDQFLF